MAKKHTTLREDLYNLLFTEGYKQADDTITKVGIHTAKKVAGHIYRADAHGMARYSGFMTRIDAYFGEDTHGVILAQKLGLVA